MGEQQYKDLMDYLHNNGKAEFADSLFKLFIRNRKLSSENSALKMALQAGITVHVHNDGQRTLSYPPNPISIPGIGIGPKPNYPYPNIGPMMSKAGFNAGGTNQTDTLRPVPSTTET